MLVRRHFNDLCGLIISLIDKSFDRGNDAFDERFVSFYTDCVLIGVLAWESDSAGEISSIVRASGFDYDMTDICALGELAVVFVFQVVRLTAAADEGFVMLLVNIY